MSSSLRVDDLCGHVRAAGTHRWRRGEQRIAVDGQCRYQAYGKSSRVTTAAIDARRVIRSAHHLASSTIVVRPLIQVMISPASNSSFVRQLSARIDIGYDGQNTIARCSPAAVVPVVRDPEVPVAVAADPRAEPGPPGSSYWRPGSTRWRRRDVRSAATPRTPRGTRARPPTSATAPDAASISGVDRSLPSAMDTGVTLEA